MSAARSLLSCLALLALVWAAWGAEEITTELSGVPTEVEEGGKISFTVAYDVPGDLGEVELRVELKNLQHIVLRGQAVKVSGKGSHEFSFDAPTHAEEAQVIFAIWYGEVWTRALAPIIHTDQIAVLTREDVRRVQAMKGAGERWRAAHQDVLAPGPAVALLRDELPDFDQRLSKAVFEEFQCQGLRPVALTTEQAANPWILNTENFYCFALSSSHAYPSEAKMALHKFLASGGDLIALETPAFTTPVTKFNGTWMTQEQIRDMLSEQQAEKLLWTFEDSDANDWGYTGGPESHAEKRIADEGAKDTKGALHCVVPNYRNWDTIAAPEVSEPFEPGQSLTCLWAKGGAGTTSLALEWIEKDGSRWIATIPLTTSWRHYALTPEQFKYWHDSPSGRGGPSDVLNVQEAAKFTVGIAMTHTPMRGGRHEFWIDELGVARNRFGHIDPPEAMAVEPVEMVTPGYKLHQVTTAESLRVSAKQCLLPAMDLPVYGPLMSVHPRPQGTGYDKERKWRWIPLLEAFDATGEVCGTPACMVINRVGRFKNSITASFALPYTSYHNPDVIVMIGSVARRMRDGLFLLEGGAQYYAYFEGEDVILGARTIDTRGRAEGPFQARFFVTSKIGTEFEKTVAVLDGKAECTWRPGQFSTDTYEVTCTLIDGDGKVLDMLKHPLLVWRPSPDPQYMQVREGHFYLGGARWRAHGVNYMPSSEIGIEDGEYFENWMGKQPYDPVVIQRDLKRIKAMGMNMVSIFCYYRSVDSRNLLDILERCRRLGLMVNLSLRPGTPLYFRWEEMKALIETHRLSEHDIILAYDLAWEPNFGSKGHRKPWDDDWREWIIERYGSIASAEADWGVPAPRQNGGITGPSDEQLSQEGKHRVMVCAYRRFLDDLLAKYHAIANGLVKSIDPNHLTSFRMSMAGDPTSGPTWIGYSFRALARSVDIMEPEGYGRIGEWDKVRPGMFTAAYARCMAPGRPVMWAEFGNSSWDRAAMKRDTDREAWTGAFYDRFYRMAYESDTDGTVNWYWPGGYRYNERSDYGIINPDGSWRPNSHSIADWADRMTTPPESGRVDEWLTIDRDATVKGLQGVYDRVEASYWQLVESGKRVGLRTDGHGLDSATAPRIAVGNVPYKPGQNPHKYLNAEFDALHIKNAGGEWQQVTDGSIVKIRRGDPVLVRATVGNNGEAKWLAAEGRDRQVVLTAGEALIPVPEDVPFMGTAQIDGFQVCELRRDMDITFEMQVWPEVSFGEKVTVRLRVR